MSSQSPHQTTLAATLKALGWHDMHVRPVYDRQADVWITPTTAKGWPDLTAVHPRTGVMLFAECKGKVDLKTKDWSTQGVKPHQLEWLHWLHAVPCAAAVVLRPSDPWTVVADMLSDPRQLVSGFGWLPPEQRRRVWTTQAIAHLAR